MAKAPVTREVRTAPRQGGRGRPLLAGAFEVCDELEQIGFPLLHDYKGHPSLRSLVHEGYEVITFGCVRRITTEATEGG